jgi:hypothetical protein
MTERYEIGGNLPPSMSVTAGEVMRDLSSWMAEHPIIATDEEARESKVYLDRAKLCIADLEDEREKLVRPLNAEVQRINDVYRSPRTLLERVLNELKNRVSAFIRQEEEKRQRIAEEARRKAEAAELAAREAERVEQERIANISSGELGVDVAAAIEDADKAFNDYKRAERQAALAERETKVKIAGGFGRAISNRNKETLIVKDAVKAVTAMADNEGIHEAIIKAARSYRSLRNQLPPGVISETERKL